MIRKILTYYAERLEEYLSRTHRRPEGLAAFFDRLGNGKLFICICMLFRKICVYLLSQKQIKWIGYGKDD